MSHVTKSEIFLHNVREIDKWLLMFEIFTMKSTREDCANMLGISVDWLTMCDKLTHVWSNATHSIKV